MKNNKMIKNITLQPNFTTVSIKNNAKEHSTTTSNIPKSDTISFNGTQKDNNDIISKIKGKITKLFLNKNAVNLLVESKNEEFNRLREYHKDYYPFINNKNLQNKNLESVNLKDTYILKTSIDEANFTKVIAGFANFENVSANKTTFKEAQMYMAEFINSSLNEADFSNVSAHFLKFRNVKTDKIIFSNADLYGANLKECDFSTAKFDGASLLKSKLNNVKVDIEELKKTTPETQEYINKKYVLIDQNSNKVTMDDAKGIVTIKNIPGLIY